jgi:hypothetical protein
MSNRVRSAAEPAGLFSRGDWPATIRSMLHRQQMRREPLLHASGQHRHPILLSFTTPDHDLVALEVEVLDAEFNCSIGPGGLTRIAPESWSACDEEIWSLRVSVAV